VEEGRRNQDVELKYLLKLDRQKTLHSDALKQIQQETK
jgi:hypothetical protein